MRKIKITALLLAVLMIVTAFAGCASKSTVTNLDNKVNDLDASIEEQKAALSGIESTLATISKALENQGSSDNLDEVIKDIEENEKATADLAGAIKDLQSAIEDLKKEPATQAPAETSKELETAINQYSAKLEALAGTVEDDKANYTAETLTAIRELVGEVETSIENAKDKAAVEAAYKAFEAKLADKAFMSVNGKLYAYVLELKGNITDASADKVDEAVEALEAAKKFYKHMDPDEATALTKYEIDEDETIDLVAAIDALEDAQYIELPAIKAQAQNIDAEIAKIDASYTFADVTAILSTYKAWEKDAKALSPENVKLVKNYADLLKAHTSALNSDVAKTIFAASELESKLYDNYGKDETVFYDYVVLMLAGEQVLYVYDTEKQLADGTKVPTKALTSKIYAAIDAWVADWAKEYGLTDLAVETIINAWAKTEGLGDEFYAKYNADKALVAAFEAEAKKITDGAFANIKALNSKRLGADAVEVLNTYKKNAADIEAWRKALVDAYEADLLADDDERDTRNIWNLSLYEDALEANFNAMVVEAKLCEYDADTKTYAPYGLGFDVKVAGNEYYHKLYDFKDEPMEQFLLVTFKEAQAAADVINARIKNFKTAQAHSIVAITTNIGGYVELDGNKLVALGETSIRDGAAGTPDTIAEFIYKYKTTAKYDLSSMLNVADYEAKVAEVEKNIKAADAALADLDTAYGKYLKTDCIVTMNDYAQITALYGLLQSWMKVGHVEMAIASETGTTNGVKEYKLTNLLDRYENIDLAALNTKAASMTSTEANTGAIILAKYRADQLKKEADLAVSAYQMMDKVYNFHNVNSFSFDNHSINGVAKAVLQATRTHFASNGVVAVTVGTPMTADGTDTKGRAYKQGQSFWTVEYVVLGGSETAPKFQTKKLEGYYYSDYSALADAKNADKSSDIRKDLAAKTFGTADDVTSLSAYVEYVFETIPTLVKDSDFFTVSDKKNTIYQKLGSGKCIPNFILPMIAMTIEGRFLVDNYNEEYAALTNAKKNWDPENGGYGFNYIKGLTYAYVDNALVDKGLDNSDNATASNKAAVNKATDIESLRIAVKACLVDIKGSTEKIVYGGADKTSMTNLYKVSDAVLEAADIKDEDLIVPGLVIYKECDHDALTSGTCGTITCPDCSEQLKGEKDHTAPANANLCEGYECTVCGEKVAPKHTLTITVTKLWTDSVTGEIGDLEYDYVCTGCTEVSGEGEVEADETGYVDVDQNGTLSATDTVTFDVVVGGVDYGTVTFAYDGSVWAAV